MEDASAQAGHRVRALRLGRGWTQRELERRTNAAQRPVSHSTISQLERGKTKRVSLDVLEAIAVALGIPVTDLLPAGGRSHEGSSRVESGGGEAVEDADAMPRSGIRAGITSVSQQGGSGGRGRNGGTEYARVPVFRYGTVGDPASPTHAPRPAGYVTVEEGLVYGADGVGGVMGRSSWGVVLVGNELSGWRLETGGRLMAGTACFCHPEAVKDTPRAAWVDQLVIAADLGGRLIVGVLKPRTAEDGADGDGGAATEGDGRRWVVTTYRLGGGPHLRQRVSHVYGNVVWYQPPGSFSALPDAEDERDRPDAPPAPLPRRTG